MGFLFLVILTLFLPSCAGANLRELGVEPPQQGTMTNPRALSTVSRHLTRTIDSVLWNKALKKLKYPNYLTENFDDMITQTHNQLKVIVKEGEELIHINPLPTRMMKYTDLKLSKKSLYQFLLAEIERGRRWNNGQVLHKQSGTSMALKRSDEEFQHYFDEGLVSPLRISQTGRGDQFTNAAREKVMAFCIVIRRKGGEPLVGPREEKEGLWFANREDIEMVLISSSNQAKDTWITVKGGRDIDEEPIDAALRETKEECGFEVTPMIRLQDEHIEKTVKDKRGKKKKEKSLWETWLMEAIYQYEVWSEDGRLRTFVDFVDAVKVIAASDGKMAEKVWEATAHFGKRWDA